VVLQRLSEGSIQSSNAANTCAVINKLKPDLRVALELAQASNKDAGDVSDAVNGSVLLCNAYEWFKTIRYIIK
jgi:hypothetical protein